MSQRKAQSRSTTKPKMSEAAKANAKAADKKPSPPASEVIPATRRSFMTGRELAGGWLQFLSGGVCQVVTFSDSDKYQVTYIRDGRVIVDRVRHMHNNGIKFLPTLDAEPQPLETTDGEDLL